MCAFKIEFFGRIFVKKLYVFYSIKHILFKILLKIK